MYSFRLSLLFVSSSRCHSFSACFLFLDLCFANLPSVPSLSLSFSLFSSLVSPMYLSPSLMCLYFFIFLYIYPSPSLRFSIFSDSYFYLSASLFISRPLSSFIGIYLLLSLSTVSSSLSISLRVSLFFSLFLSMLISTSIFSHKTSQTSVCTLLFVSLSLFHSTYKSLSI